MINAHKIQECLADYTQLYSRLPRNHAEDAGLEELLDQEMFVKKTTALLDDSVKFDLGKINLESVQTLYDTGKECVEAGLFSLPFETFYVEFTLVDDATKRRFGIMCAPLLQYVDASRLCQHPEFLGGMAALHFVRKNQTGAERHSWEIPTLITIFNREFTEGYVIPAAKAFADYAAMTEFQYQEAKQFSTSMLYIAHSLINARGIEIQTEPAPAKLNRRRDIKNKPPLYEHHVLKIGGFSSSGKVLGVGASHASPRAHWRRGHIRTVRRGTPHQKRIAIPACLINGPGFVSKDYEISR